MALTGTWERSIDSKGRLAIPKPLKEALTINGSDELFLAPGNEGCLSVYAPEQFERYAGQLAEWLPGGRVATIEESATRSHYLVRDGALDPDGRLPNNTHGGLISEAYVHGMNNIAEGVRLVRGES